MSYKVFGIKMDFMVLFCKNSVKCVHQMPGTLLLLATEHTLTVKKNIRISL